MKKKLSLLLAGLLVMTLVPVSSFAAGAASLNTGAIAAEIGQTDKKVTVKYEAAVGDDMFATGDKVQFDLSNKVKFKNDANALKVYNADGVLIGNMTNVMFLNDNNSVVKAELPGITRPEDQRKIYFEFSLDFNSSDIESGDFLLNGVSLSNKDFKIVDLKLGTISERNTTQLSVKAKDDKLNVSKDGGFLSEFTVTNFANGKANYHVGNKTAALVMYADNYASFSDKSEVRIDRILQPISTAAPTDSTVAVKDGMLIIGKDLLKDKTSVVVRPYVTLSQKNTTYSDVYVTVLNTEKWSDGNQGFQEAEAKIGAVIEWNITMKAVALGKKEIASVIAGKESKVQVTLEGPKGAFRGNMSFELDGAELTTTAASALSWDVNPADSTFDIDDEDEFDINTADQAKLANVTKMQFVMTVKTDADSDNTTATMKMTSRDYKDGLTVDIVKILKAYDIKTKVTEVKRGETKPTADIAITEINAGELKVGDYVNLVYNGKMSLNEEPVVEGSNGLVLEKVKLIKDLGEQNGLGENAGIQFRVKARSKKEAGTINVSKLTTDMQINAIHDRTYTISLWVGTKSVDSKGNITTKELGQEFAEFKYAKAVAFYAATTPKIIFTLGSANYTVDGVANTLEAPVFTKDNRTMLPIGPLALALGLDVNYNADTKIATFKNVTTGQIVSVTENAPVLYSNGIQYKMYTSATTVNGRIFVPVASITDAFGAKIAWDAAAQTVTIN